MQMVLTLHNLHGGGEPNRDRRKKIIIEFLNATRGGMGGFNELNRAERKFFKSEAKHRGLKTFIYHQDGAVWDPNRIKVRKKRVKKIMTGGFVGADGVSTARRGDDDRRVGPNRYAIYFDCFSGNAVEFEFVVTHLMAKSFTQHTWRVRLLHRSIKSLSSGIRKKRGVLVGDMNSKEYIDLPGVKDTPEKTPPTHGPRRYDQMVRWGEGIDVVQIEGEETPSDHDMVKGILKLWRSPGRK